MFSCLKFLSKRLFFGYFQGAVCIELRIHPATSTRATDNINYPKHIPPAEKGDTYVMHLQTANITTNESSYFSIEKQSGLFSLTSMCARRQVQCSRR